MSRTQHRRNGKLVGGNTQPKPDASKEPAKGSTKTPKAEKEGKK